MTGGGHSHGLHRYAVDMTGQGGAGGAAAGWAVLAMIMIRAAVIMAVDGAGVGQVLIRLIVIGMMMQSGRRFRVLSVQTVAKFRRCHPP